MSFITLALWCEGSKARCVEKRVKVRLASSPPLQYDCFNNNNNNNKLKANGGKCADLGWGRNSVVTTDFGLLFTAMMNRVFPRSNITQ